MDKAIKDLDVYISDGNYSSKYPRSEEFVEAGIPFIRANNLVDGDITDEDMYFITPKKHSFLLKGHVKSGDVLITTRGNIGQVAIVPDRHEDSNINAQIVLLRTRKDDLYNRYLLWALQSRSAKEQYLTLQTGTALKQLPVGKLEQLRIKIIDIENQHKVANNLDKIFRLIKTRQEELTLLDNLIKARFVEMFGDPKINEKNWETGIVSDFYEVKGGKRIPKGMGYADGVTKHPYLRATDMKNETILDDDIHYINDEVFEKIKRYTVKGGDIYLTNVGVNLGMAGVIPDKYNGANLTENAVKLVPKSEMVLDGVFLAHYINSPGIQDYINERKMSVGVPKLAIFRIETMPLILPPMNLQIQFINFCKQVYKSKVAVQKSLDETQKLFDSLMQEYFG